MLATPPTRVLYTEPASGWSALGTAGRTTPTFNVTAGDLLTVIGLTEDSTVTLTTPTASGGSVTWTLRQSVVVSGYGVAYAWTGAVGATATGITVSSTLSSSSKRGSIGVTVWRDHGGVGVSNKANATGGPSLALSTSANSAVVCGNADWNALDGASRVWRTVNGSPMTEDAYVLTSGVYTIYVGYRTDTGAAGTSTLGLSAPSGQAYSIVGVEVLGVAGGTPGDVAAVAATASAAAVAPSVSGGGAASVSAVPATASAAAQAPAVTAESEVSGGGPATATAQAHAPVVTGLRVGLVAAVVAAATAQAIAPGVSAAGTGTVAAVPATASAAAVAPSVSAACTVQGVAASGTGQALAPAVAGAAMVQAVAASAASQAAPPTLTGAAAIAAVPGMASAQAPAPFVSAGGTATVSAVPAVATAAAQAPAVSAGSVIAAVTAVASAAAVPPSVGAASVVQSVPATAAASVYAPVVVGLRAGVVAAVPAVATAAGLPPMLSGIPLRDLVLAAVQLDPRFTVLQLTDHFESVSLADRWSVARLEGEAMRKEVLVSAGAAEYVGGTVTELTGKDISGATFMMSLGGPTNPGAWVAPTVSTAGDGNDSRVLKLLVNSSSPKGTFYAWARISDSPEVAPVRFPQEIIIR